MEQPEEKDHCIWRPTEPIILSPDTGLKERQKTEKEQQKMITDLDKKLKLAVQALAVETERSAIFEEHAKAKEIELNSMRSEFSQYKQSTDEKIEKVAQLISQLMK